MPFEGWDPSAFEAMEVPGFAARMEAIRTRVRPRLQAIAEELAPELSRRAGETLYPHVALHARRTVNPPEDTWCAWSPSPRGYKKHPHLQLGIRAQHVYVQAGVILEAPFRPRLADLLLEQAGRLRAELPAEAVWKDDHTSPTGVAPARPDEEALQRLAQGLRLKSRGDLMVSLHWPRSQAVAMGAGEFLQQALAALERLLPVYRLARQAEREAAPLARPAPAPRRA